MEKLWYYASNNARQGPVTETELRDRIQRGEVRPDDLIWTDGMPDWVKAKDSVFSQRPELPQAPAPEASAQPGDVPAPATAETPPRTERPVALHELPPGMLGWMKFNGVMFILQGVFYALGCLTIIIGVPMVIAGMALMGAAGQLENGAGIPPSLTGFFDKLKTFNVALGVCHIMTLIGYILAILFSIVFFGAFVAALSQAFGQAGSM